jgi:hypothetical protein
VQAPDAAASGSSAQPLPTGTQPPLSSSMLQLLIGQQLALYGSFNA